MSEGQLAIYCRVSSQTQKDDGTSLVFQQQRGVELAQQLNLTPKIYNEGAASSHTDDLTKRPTVLRLLNDVEKGYIKNVFVWSMDRLGRNETALSLIKAKLQSADVKLYTNGGQYDLTDPQSNFMFNVMNAFSVLDNAIRMERFRSGKLERLKTSVGHWKGGPPPFGYQLEDKKLVENKKESKWVNKIFEMYSENKSLEQIRMTLMSNGVLSRRGNAVFSTLSIRKILSNTHYGGYYSYTDRKTNETITIQCPPIVPQPLIDKVSEIHSKRSKGQRKERETKQTYLLNSFLFCSHCGSRYTVYKHNSDKQLPYYYCLQKTNYHKNKTEKCVAKRNLSMYQTDQTLFDLILKVVSESNLFKETVKEELVGDRDDVISGIQKKKYNDRIKKLNTEIEKIQSSIQTLINNEMGDDEVLQKLKEKVDEHQSEIDGINQILINSKRKAGWIDWVGEFDKRIERLHSAEVSIDEKKDFLQRVIERINVESPNSKDHNIEIHFKLPYVDDKLEWRNPKDKSKGYELKDGKKLLKTTLSASKKSIQNKEL